MNKKSLTVLVVVLALALIAVSVLFSLEKSSGAQLSAEIEMLTADAEAKSTEIASLTADVEAKSAEVESLTALTSDDNKCCIAELAVGSCNI